MCRCQQPQPICLTTGDRQMNVQDTFKRGLLVTQGPDAEILEGAGFDPEGEENSATQQAERLLDPKMRRGGEPTVRENISGLSNLHGLKRSNCNSSPRNSLTKLACSVFPRGRDVRTGIDQQREVQLGSSTR